MRQGYGKRPRIGEVSLFEAVGGACVPIVPEELLGISVPVEVAERFGCGIENRGDVSPLARMLLGREAVKGWFYGEDNIISGLAIDTGGINPRAAAVVWTCKKGLVNDIKFYGGHGSFDINTGQRIPPYGLGRVGEPIPGRKWDSQYPSLMIKGGGGMFKNIWTASPYASAGLYIEDTKNEIEVYAISLEHHVRNELVMKNVENAKLYGVQFEEEKNEGEFVLPIRIIIVISTDRNIISSRTQFLSYCINF